MTYTERDTELADSAEIARELAEITAADIAEIDLDFSIDMPAPNQSREVIRPECGHRFEMNCRV